MNYLMFVPTRKRVFLESKVFGMGHRLLGVMWVKDDREVGYEGGIGWF